MDGNIIRELAQFYHVNCRDCVILNGYLLQLLRSGQRTDLFGEMYRRHVLGVVREVEGVGGQDEVEVVEEPYWDYLYRVNGKPGEKQ